jgi:hypothetical protein
MTTEVRSVIHFFDLLDTPDDDILVRIENTYGKGIAQDFAQTFRAVQQTSGQRSRSCHQGDETWVAFENPRSTMWLCAEVRRPTQPKQLICAKKVMFWVCFTPIGIVEILMLPPGEADDSSFFVNIVLNSLKKKLAQTPDPNPEKGHFAFG